MLDDRRNAIAVDVEVGGFGRHVVTLIAANDAACRRIVGLELEKERLGAHLDAMSNEDIKQLKQELLERVSGLGIVFRDTDP